MLLLCSGARVVGGGITAAADGCATVLLDIGSNVGTHLQNLFEPEQRPGAPIQSYYDEYLGTARARDRTLCAIGMEASPAAEAHLAALRDAYIGRGFRVALFLRTAAGLRNGTADLSYTPPHQSRMTEESAQRSLGSLPSGPRAKHVPVTVVDLAQFIRQHVLERALPSAGVRGRVGLYMDVEGAELELLPRLVESGVLCGLDFAYVEMHTFVGGKAHRAQYRARGEALLARLRAQLAQSSCRVFLVDSWEFSRRPPRYALGATHRRR